MGAVPPVAAVVVRPVVCPASMVASDGVTVPDINGDEGFNATAIADQEALVKVADREIFPVVASLSSSIAPESRSAPVVTACVTSVSPPLAANVVDARTSTPRSTRSFATVVVTLAAPVVPAAVEQTPVPAVSNGEAAAPCTSRPWIV